MTSIVAGKKVCSTAIIKQFRTYLLAKRFKGFLLVVQNITKAKKNSMQQNYIHKQGSFLQSYDCFLRAIRTLC